MNHIITILMIWLISFFVHADISQTHHINTVTGAKTWQTDVDGVHFSLTQILPEQAKAFYINRGFTLDQIDAYTSSCVYMMILRNDDATGDIHFVRNKMSFYVKNKSHTALPISQWLDRLSNADANKSALLAFRWAQFQAEQTYKPGGDWNQGMLSVGLPSGEIFNAILKWDIENKEYEGKLTGVQCAE